MKRHPSRLVPLVAATVLVLGACGSDDGTADDVPPSVDDSSDEGLIAPRPIEVTGGGGGGALSASAEAAPAADRATSDMVGAYPYRVTTFVAGDELPELPTNDVGYVFEAGAEVSSGQVAELAAALGVAGEPVLIDGEPSGSWRVGPEDGTAPSLWVYQDAQQSWNYNTAWADQAVSGGGCAVAGSAGAPEVDVAAAEPAIAPDVPVSSEVLVDPAVSTPVCEAPAPPEGVLTADEATQRTRDLMVAVGLDPESFTLEPYADEWYASVGAVEQLDGTFNGRRFDTGFGAAGVLQYASGQLAVPARVGPYPLIDLDTAIARLNDPSGYYGGGMIALDTAVAHDAVSEPAVEPPVAVDMPEASVDPVIAESTPPTAPAPTEPAPDAGSGVDPAVPPATEVSAEFEPEQVTVTLVDVQPDVWWAWDVDGSVWLLPAYRFIGDDGGWYTVPAVPDEFLIQVPVDTIPVEPVPVTEPAPVPETIPTVSVPGESTPPGDTVADVTTLEELVGTSLVEFTKEVEARGLTVRVVEQDGVALPATMDYLPDRVNVAVEGEGDAATVVRIVNLG